jgi:hypothetical protein
MMKLFFYGIIAVAIYSLATGSFGIIERLQNGSTALVLQGITKDELDQTILNHYKDVVLRGVTDLTADTIETTIADLNEDGKKDVIAIVQSEATCGSGGCIASIFLENEVGELTAVPFQYALRHIEVLESMTNSMHDLRINHDTTSRMIWNGAEYVKESI